MAYLLLKVILVCGPAINLSTATILGGPKHACSFIDTINITGNFVHNMMSVNKTEYLTGSSGTPSGNGIPANRTNHSSDIVIGGSDGAGGGNGGGGGDNGGGNVTYIYDWMVIPNDLIAVYDFIIRNGVRIPVERHLRACICKLKPCIRFCCAQDHYYDVINQKCTTIIHSDNNNNNTLDQNSMRVRRQNGSYYNVSTTAHFTVQIGLPCDRMRYVFADDKNLIQWTLLENGTIAYKHHHLTKYYCYSPYSLDNMTWTWQPLVCPTDKLPYMLGVREWTYVICLIIATICMGIIFFMHLFCTEIRNTFYGVAIKSYSLCIIVGYSMMVHLVLTEPSQISETSCAFIPCFVLFFLLLSFYILSFISFHIYLNFNGIVMTKLMFWFILFPIACLAIGWSLFVGFENYGGKPVFGGDTCWFDPRNWAIMIYLNAPIMVACSVSVFFYILTLIRIREHQESSSKSLVNAMEENRYTAFWKFFSYTFIMWLVCVISFVINYYREVRTHINYAVCLIVILHGFGSLYALIGKNQQIQNFLRRIEDGIDEDDEDVCESALPMTPLDRE